MIYSQSPSVPPLGILILRLDLETPVKTVHALLHVVHVVVADA